MSLRHSDALQLLRIRFRLTDLCYTLLDLPLNLGKQQTKVEIASFLRRRCQDTVAMGVREIIPSVQDCRILFNHALFVLRREARRQEGLSKVRRPQLARLSSLLE